MGQQKNEPSFNSSSLAKRLHERTDRATFALDLVGFVLAS
jgi:hypothetical protein